MIPVKRSYLQQSSPGQTKGLKGGFKEWAGGLAVSEGWVDGWVGGWWAEGWVCASHRVGGE